MRLFLHLILLLSTFGLIGFKAEQHSFSNSKTNCSNQKSTDTIKRVFFPDSEQQNRWVDSVYNQMNLEEKIGQLFMVAAYSNKNETHVQAIESLIENQKIGGVIFFQGGPMRQANLTNRFQAKAKIPLFIGIDAEWGLSMRLDSTYVFPWNMTLGAIEDLDLIEKLGSQMAEHCKRMGIHFSFAPVVDVNTNPQNPVIGNRSFGENPENVAQKAVALTKGLQTNGIFATAKHFPGHGDTDKDSHHTLPIVNHSLERLHQVELHPYKELFRNGLASVMVAHLNIPALESRTDFPSSISKNIVTDLLQKELKFEGLIFTDALNMKGASNFKNPGEIDLEAFLAGNDILLFPENVPIAIEKFKFALANKKLSEERLEHSVKKILKYKHKAQLFDYKPIDTTNLIEDLNTIPDEALHHKLMENALTVLKNNNEILPIKNLDKQKIAYVRLGDDNGDYFVETLQKYADVSVVKSQNLSNLIEQLKQFSVVIVGYHKSNQTAWKNHNFSLKDLTWLYEIARTNKVILSVFAKPYSLNKIQTFENIDALIVSYQNSKIGQEVTANLIFGSSDANGKLPVSINSDFSAGNGLSIKNIQRLGFDVPENVGMNSAVLTKIDSIANKTILEKIAPGMQILIARKGKVVYQKSFGYHTYDSIKLVKNSDLYDVASLTKIIATLPMVISNFEQNNIHLNTKLSEMLPIFDNTDKKNITLKELLTHNSGLRAWIPFYKATLDSLTALPKTEIYSKTYSNEFPYKVADSLYIKKSYSDTISKKIINSELGKKEYRYSDLSFIILKEFLEKKSGKTLDVLIDENYYQSLGMYRTTYNPLQKFDKNEIVPTENDTYFRHQFLQGYVHDMAAAMQGGVAGQAGVFSNSLDTAKMMQLYLQKGTYGNRDYFSEKTFEKFNSLYYEVKKNRRGLGFDKPTGNNNGTTCTCVSMDSFGHTGFTGTMAWADPKTETIFVFLSNRTYPDSKAPNRLAKEHIRSSIQEVVSRAIVE